MVRLKHVYNLEQAYDPIDDDMAVKGFLFHFSVPGESCTEDPVYISNDYMKREGYHDTMLEEALPVIRKALRNFEVVEIAFLNTTHVGRHYDGYVLILVEHPNELSREFDRHMEEL